MGALTGGTAAAQASDSRGDSSLPPSAPAAAMSPPNGAAPPEEPRSPGNTLGSRADALVSCDTDMASSAVVAAAGERVSPIFGSGEQRDEKTKKVKQYLKCQTEISWKELRRHATLTVALCARSGSCVPVAEDWSLCERMSFNIY